MHSLQTEGYLELNHCGKRIKLLKVENWKTYLTVFHESRDEEPGQIFLQDWADVKIEQLAEDRTQLGVTSCQGLEKPEQKNIENLY